MGGRGKSKWLYERVSVVVFGGMRLVFAYQPLWGTVEDGMNDYLKKIGNLGLV